eukprot:scaffold87_cov388-Prasinococcus_capsulatus_cf.AAC.19
MPAYAARCQSFTVPSCMPRVGVLGFILTLVSGCFHNTSEQECGEMYASLVRKKASHKAIGKDESSLLKLYYNNRPFMVGCCTSVRC